VHDDKLRMYWLLYKLRWFLCTCVCKATWNLPTNQPTCCWGALGKYLLVLSLWHAKP